MFNKKSKMFKWIVVLVLLISIAITVKIIDNSNGKTENEKSISEETEEKEGSSLHIGIGHIVMLVLLIGAYGIDKAVVYSNKLKEDKLYKNNEED